MSKHFLTAFEMQIFSKKGSYIICGFEGEILPSNWILSTSWLAECWCSTGGDLLHLLAF